MYLAILLGDLSAQSWGIALRGCGGIVGSDQTFAEASCDVAVKSQGQGSGAPRRNVEVELERVHRPTRLVTVTVVTRFLKDSAQAAAHNCHSVVRSARAKTIPQGREKVGIKVPFNT
jgi:hypothetical protein